MSVQTVQFSLLLQADNIIFSSVPKDALPGTLDGVAPGAVSGAGGVGVPAETGGLGRLGGAIQG